MIITLLVTFFGLLIIGMPIAVMMISTAVVTMLLNTSESLLVIPQQLFNALDNSVLLSIPFFILAGVIMTEGATAPG